ncbi:3'-5' exonuclease [Acetobacter persici]|uniref:3'-5' exoribonuclease Rv2179c-like domain-containing protein n=1 Tax=Acetobacter persici TaxID=1076596 RepID=A0A1U9LJC7_9PROT|nr:3'-5' exonuclease [Acetobacter persici]AQT06507.1 hypothetical protein A0U91_15990 [Acetobacter persici]
MDSPLTSLTIPINRCDLIPKVARPSRTRDIIVDIETLGDVAESVVLSIGAASIDVIDGRYEVYSTFYSALPFAEQFSLGRVSTPDTMKKFWPTVTDRRASEVFIDSAQTPFECREVLTCLSEWILQVAGEEAIVHGCGPSFDNAIIRNLCDNLKMPLPWKFRNEGCLRTALRSVAGVERIKSKIPHHALEDAIAEAQTLCLIQHSLGPNPPVRFITI